MNDDHILFKCLFIFLVRNKMGKRGRKRERTPSPSSEEECMLDIRKVLAIIKKAETWNEVVVHRDLYENGLLIDGLNWLKEIFKIYHPLEQVTKKD